MNKLGRSLKVARVRARARLIHLAAWIWRRLMVRTTVIGITGSVGKTTAKECIAAVLGAHAPTWKTIDNRNDLLGVPQVILGMRPHHRYAVIEMATGEPGRIDRLARLVRPDIGVLTAVAATHTNKFPDLEATAREKSDMLRHVARNGLAILNGDDVRVRAMRGMTKRTLLLGEQADNDWRAEDVESRWPQRLGFTLRTDDDAVAVRTQLVGTHWVFPAMASLAVARVLGVPLQDALAGLAGVPPFAGRMQPLTTPGGATIIRDEENGSLHSMRAMLEVARDATATRRVFVVSDLTDTGKAKPNKRLFELGQMVAELADLAVFVGRWNRHALRGARSAGMRDDCTIALPTVRDAAEYLNRALRPSDLVFVKGRTTDHLSRAVFAQFGAIGCWKEDCRIHRVCDGCKELRPGFDLGSTLDAARTIPVSIA